MDSQDLKDYIIDNDKIPDVLESLNCGNIISHSTFYSASNPDGNNKVAINVYKDSLVTIDYTRDIPQTNGTSDLFSLVQFFNKCNFFEALKFTCSVIGLDYYDDLTKEIDPAIAYTKMIMQLNKIDDADDEDDKPVKPISEHILTYYKPYVNDQFANDNIPYNVQRIFEIGYDEQSNRITIPIRDELGALCGVKGRWFGTIPDGVSKYTYIEPCNKGKILYNLWLAYDFIKKMSCVYVFESEKAVMQAYSYGYYNCVASCGCKITQHQIRTLERISHNIIFCYDSDITREKIDDIADKFIEETNVYAIIDKQQIYLKKEEKVSPTDKGKEVFQKLLNNCRIKLKQ